MAGRCRSYNYTRCGHGRKHINYKNGLSIDIPSKDYVISDKDIGMRSSHEHPWVAGSLRRKMSHIKLAFKRK
jgi:hypothetical protein